MSGAAESFRRRSVVAAPASGMIAEIRPGLLWLRMPLPIKIGHVNAYLMEDDGGWAVVDPGYADEASIEVWRSVLAGPHGAIRKIIVTHHHVDHSGMAGWLHQATGAPLLMGEIEYLTYRLAAADPGHYARASFQAYLRRNGVDGDNAQAIARVLTHRAGFTPPPDRYVSLKPGEPLRLGGRTLDVTTGEGHSTGQIMLRCAGEDWMITADQLLGALQPIMILPHCEPDGDPLARLSRSLDDVAAVVTADTLALPGHYQPFRDMPRAIARLKRHHRQRRQRVADLCREKPMSAAEIAAITFATDLNPRQLNHAVGEIVPYANSLVAEGVMRWLEPDPLGVCRLAPV
ncbi:MAG: MBL fold metallo-hydrolase [Rhizobiaceae bacterium]|nr:MBL fold metallo-hydrolase [Rhizobiaceae bacterium]